ncbi:hypothetical protein [Myxococcus hansupus]|uniref:hypothetical protein n=1 Tax=Pseudomyxococcus hansupus TaxID=1297742 RepID=UPI00118743F7|nr:hypothetical protein [Myxococcus hansupus]
MKAELIQVVREELTARGEARVVDDGARVPAPEPSAQSLVAQQESYQVIDAAARARRWTNEDRDALRRAFVEMAPNQRIEVMRRFSTSLNGKKIDLQTQGAPF